MVRKGEATTRSGRHWSWRLRCSPPVRPRRRPGRTGRRRRHRPAGVDITGVGLTEPLRLRADTAPTQVVAVIDQVSWFGRTGAGRDAEAGRPRSEVHHRGARRRRPPSRRTTSTRWPRAVRGPSDRPSSPTCARPPPAGSSAGSPCPRRCAPPGCRWSGGSTRSPVASAAASGRLPEDGLNPGRDLDDAIAELQRLLLLNVGVMLVITVGLAGIALLVRRRTR